MKKNFTIGISCIGSGVGQSVINSLKHSRLPFRTIGLGTNPFAFGAYDCDAYDYTKTIYDPEFIDDLIRVCKKHQVDLIVPGLDDEALMYAQNQDKFEAAGIKTICSGVDLIEICRDKEKMSNVLNPIADVFVKSFSFSNYKEAFDADILKLPFIAKPRGGFASKGVEIINAEADFSRINEGHIIQELAIPSSADPNHDFFVKQLAKNINPQVSEVSIQLVYDPQGNLMGKMASYNKLNNGVPIEILPFEDDYIWEIVDKLTPTLLALGLKGPLNIQGRLTDTGLKIFEMNPRFTGITGLRALMGFNEVEACVKEWLGIDVGANTLIMNNNRFGIRQTMDKSIPIERNDEVVQLFKKINGRILKTKKSLLITGANGYLGRNLIAELSNRYRDNYEIFAFGRNKEKLQNLFSAKNVQVVDEIDLKEGRLSLGNIELIIHLGFTRPQGTNTEIAESIAFSTALFTRAAINQVPAIINMSSQAVYGISKLNKWDEHTPISPETNYGHAKYSVECCLAAMSRVNRVLRYTNIRLAGLTGGGQGFKADYEILAKFVKKALTGETINLVGGMQKMQRLDVRDAVSGIIALLNSDPQHWAFAYNLGNNEQYKLEDMANFVSKVVAEKKAVNPVQIVIDPKEIDLEFALDSTLFNKQFNFNPQYTLQQSIESIIDFYEASN